ncbi:MAG: sulfide-dependent adenosine diphosphate thiazole synthase [Gemmatimonadota bacterium]|jgi:thiamine thiazole synthase
MWEKRRKDSEKRRAVEADSYETRITKNILDAYHGKMMRSVVSDVLIVGAGPSGLVAARDLARKGRKVTVLEKRLSPGGGVWGGAMAMNEVVIQEAAVEVLEEIGVRTPLGADGLYVIDAIELASALCLHAVQAGAVLLNLTTAEDLCVRGGKVRGVVANRTGLVDQMPIDPITLQAENVLDATGHEAALVHMLDRRKGLEDSAGLSGEGMMNATEGDSFVVEEVAEVFPGLWITGMTVAAVMGGPRMGPIFGGMLLSGRRAADLIDLEMAMDSVRV